MATPSDVVSIQGVVIDPIHAEPSGKIYSNVRWQAEAVDRTDLEKDTWYNLPVPRRLGIPRRFRGYKNSNEYVNWSVRIMSIDVDTTTSPRKVIRQHGFERKGEEGEWYGGTILVRNDGRDLMVQDIEILVLHVDALNEGFDLDSLTILPGKQIDQRSIEAIQRVQLRWREEGNKATLWAY